MKKSIRKVIACILVGLLVVSSFGYSGVTTQAATKKSTKVTKVTLNYEAYTLVNGKKVTLAAYSNSKKKKSKDVKWKSSNKKIATVNSKGVVTAKKTGKVTITATIKGVKKKVSCKITVVKTLAVKSVSLSLNNVSLTTGQEYQLTATVNPNNAGNKKVDWVSSNPAVASVVNGKVTALATGTTVIQATSVSGKKTATCNVTVSTPVTGLTVTPSTKKLLVNEQYQLVSTITPANADNKTVAWSSSNSEIISVSDTGLITGLRPGTATITCTSGNYKATCEVTVPTGFDVLDIQGVTDGDNIFYTFMTNIANKTSGIIVLAGKNDLSNKLAFQLAEGATYEISSPSKDMKSVTVKYKNLVRVYSLIYYKQEEENLITSISDSQNQITGYDFSSEYEGDIIYVCGYEKKLSDKFTITGVPGSTVRITDDASGNYAKLVTITKNGETYQYKVIYERDYYSKVLIQGITDNNKLFNDFYITRGVYENGVLAPGKLDLYGNSASYVENYIVEVASGATYSFSANPDKQYVSLLTITYGDMKATYNISYTQGSGAPMGLNDRK